jgi:hypothetical protein
VTRRLLSRGPASAVIATWAVAGAVLLGPVRPVPAAAYADGAPAGFSGGFREESCHACHFEAEVNTKPGQLTIAGVPERFAAGDRYTLTISLSRAGMAIAGFQLTARVEDGGAQAGTLAPAPGEEDRIKVETQTSVQYAGQRARGAALVQPATARWTLVWTAPQTAGTVLFNIAANAADNDESVRGDYVYTALASTRP